VSVSLYEASTQLEAFLSSQDMLAALLNNL